MIERFNFYDIYGYFLPGISALALLLWPFRTKLGAWAPADVGSTLVALIIGYIVGHFLHDLSQCAFDYGIRITGNSRGPRHQSSRGCRGRFPHDAFLDEDDATLSPQLKARLKARIRSSFNLDVDASSNREGIRQEAFFLCRRTLQTKHSVSYAEQFQGMYSLLRGMTGVCWLCFFYYSGWILNQMIGKGRVPAAFLTVIAGVIALAFVFFEGWSPGNGHLQRLLRKRPFENPLGVAYWALCTFLLFFAVWDPFEVGWVAGTWKLAAICAVLVLFSFRFKAAFRKFARRFAETVYRDFSISEATEK